MKSRKSLMLWRVFVGGFKNFFRNAWLSIAASAVMVVTLSIVLFSFIANATFTHTIDDIRSRIDVSVYLKDEATLEQREQLTAELKGMQNVRDVQHVSKEQALEEYRKMNEDNVDLQLAITQTDNPLPASLRIKLYNPDLLEELRLFLEKPDIKALQGEETSYSGDRKEAIDKISGATSFIQKAGLVGVVVFALISMLIIFNTIQMAIFNRRDELNIMRLLGASRSYIRGPFLVESLLIGVLAALISVALCKGIFYVASGTLDASTFGLLDIKYSGAFYSQHFWWILLSQIGIGVFIGVGSSFFATQRYLKGN